MRYFRVMMVAVATSALQFDKLFRRAKRPRNPPVVAAPANFKAPTPRPLEITRSETIPSLVSGALALAVRLATGTFVLGWTPVSFEFAGLQLGRALEAGEYALEVAGVRFRDESSVLALAPRPQRPLVLYEYDSSPFCRKVRELCCILDVPCEMRPCPGARAGFAQELETIGGKMTVPYLVDPNRNAGLYESEAIMEYLLDNYGPPRDTYDAKALWPLRGNFAVVTATLAAVARGVPCGTRLPGARPDNELMRPLELWGYESSPFVRPVRETLCALCLPHVVVPCSRGSKNRDALIAKTGRFQVPYLLDPNTGVELFESPEIVEYLFTVYAPNAPPPMTPPQPK